jgi:hypothetical protein
MSTTFSRTREQLRDMVLGKLQILAAGEPASAEDAAVVNEALDVRLKTLHADNVLWWKSSGAASNVAITSGQATATPPVDMLFPISFAILNGDDHDPVEIIGHREYAAIIQKGDTGQPRYVYWNGTSFYLWPVPDANYTGKLTYQKIIDDSAASTAPDIGVQYIRWLRDLLAYDLADVFGLPEEKIGRFMSEAALAERRIKQLNAQRVDSITVEADYY